MHQEEPGWQVGVVESMRGMMKRLDGEKWRPTTPSYGLPRERQKRGSVRHKRGSRCTAGPAGYHAQRVALPQELPS